jgi:hypothetical protein
MRYFSRGKLYLRQDGTTEQIFVIITAAVEHDVHAREQLFLLVARFVGVLRQSLRHVHFRFLLWRLVRAVLILQWSLHLDSR